ncbi:MAG: LPXTG cell wall anchor domain-containing protein, partial [Faecalibacillus sp.]
KATKRDVMVAIKDINNAIKTLQYQIIFDLNDLINDMDEVASSITEANYTKESYQSFIDAFTSGKTVLEKAKQQETEAIYQECLKAYDDLKEAFSQLTLLNRDQLAALIEKAENIDLDAYVDEGQDELKAALKKAKDIYQSVSLSQKEVDDVYKELDEAMNKLVKCADKSLLQELVNKINGLDKDKYVSETWMELEKELENSQVVLDDKNISQEKVDEAYVSLQKAYENLKEKTSNEEIKIEDPEETGEKGESSNEGNVNTGDQTTIGLYVGIAVISLLGIIMIMKKKRA